MYQIFSATWTQNMISTDWEVTRIAQSVETIAEANGVPVQVTVNHESFGVGAIQERSDNWSCGTHTPLLYRESLSNMESDVLSVVKVSRHTFWST